MNCYALLTAGSRIERTNLMRSRSSADHRSTDRWPRSNHVKSQAASNLHRPYPDGRTGNPLLLSPANSGGARLPRGGVPPERRPEGSPCTESSANRRNRDREQHRGERGGSHRGRRQVRGRPTTRATLRRQEGRRREISEP
jgi:hypothetical protein